MEALTPLQFGLIGLLFVWSGFVRSGLGFGGAVLSLPFLLLVLNAPLVFLPIISVHLLIFSGLTIVMARFQLRRDRRTDDGKEGSINWAF
ncbi:MAG: hypothetical protein NWR12_04615 [Haliea sp.]|nr:hypothetical protein [Haliea sp.]